MSFLSPLFIGITGVFALLTPLSYSGHKGLFRFANVDMTGGGYDSILPVIIKLAAILGLIYFLRKDLILLVKASGSLLKDIKEKNFDVGTKDSLKKLILMIAFGSVAFIFVPLVKFFTKGIGTCLPVIVGGFLISAYFILRSERVKEKTLKESNETILNGILVSIFNAFSYIPGVSGVGGMYFAGILSGFRREFAVKYAYLITLIWLCISFVYDIICLCCNEIIVNYGVFSYIVAFIGMLGTSVGAAILMDYSVKNRKMTGFTFYNTVIAIITSIIWIRG